MNSPITFSESSHSSHLAENKSIAELIHDRVVAEGGVLHVWKSGAKFRKVIDDQLPFDRGRWNDEQLARPVTMWDPTDDEPMDGLEPFVPSEDLRSVIVRNLFELQIYFKQQVASWRLACA